MRTRGLQWWDDGELDELELGGRVADCLYAEELGTVYASVRDRTWSVVLHCFGFIAVAAQDAGREIPPCWQPNIDEHGMWRPS